MRTNLSQLVTDAPVHDIPGIGRRTALLLSAAGVTTVGRFIELPDLLLEYAFGPSLPTIRRRTVERISDASRQQFTSLVRRFARSLFA